jgi:Tfp pilus assembly protein PilO
MNPLEKIRAFDRHTSEIAALKSRISELEASEAKVAELEAALNQGAAKIEELESLKESSAALSAKASDLETQLAAAKTEAARAYSRASTELAAKVGDTVGVKIDEVDSTPKADKPDFAKLRGLEKVIAIEKYEASIRN